jgi:hypothetical protein
MNTATSRHRLAALILAVVFSAALAVGMANIPHPGLVHDAHAAGPKAE